MLQINQAFSYVTIFKRFLITFCRTSTREASMPSTSTGQQLLQDSRTTIYFSEPIRKWKKMYQKGTKSQQRQQQKTKKQPLQLPLLNYTIHNTNTTITNITKQSFHCSLRTTEGSTFPKSVQQPI